MSLSHVLDLLLVFVVLGTVVVAVFAYEVASDSAFEPDEPPYDWERDGR